MMPTWYDTETTTSESYIEIYSQTGTTTYAPITYYADIYHDYGTASSTISNGVPPYWQPYTIVPYRFIVNEQGQLRQSSPPPIPPSKPPSPEEERTKEAERNRLKEIAEKAEKERKIAEEKAKLLLLEHLDDINRQKYSENKPLEIASRLFKDIIYNIPISRIGRIQALKDNKVISELCITVNDAQCLPTEDVVLTKLLYTKHDEENMLRTANHSSVKESLLARLN